MDLRALARDKPCLIRIPGICSQDTSTTVLCHIRISGISGAGFKAPDLLAAFGCQRCHDAVDRRIRTEFEKKELDLMLLEGMARTQYWLISEGYLAW